MKISNLGMHKMRYVWSGRALYLPASRRLVPVIGVIGSDECVNAVKVEFSIWNAHDGLSDHLSITKLGLYVPIVVMAQVDIVLVD